MSSETKHLDELLLIGYADDPASMRDPAVEAHVNACEACAAQVAQFRELADSLGDDETWWALERGYPLASALEDFDRQCAAEDAEAEDLLRPVLASQYQFAGAGVLHKKRFHTGGVVRLLCEEARRQVVKEPRFALVLAEHARIIADGLPDDHYPADAIYALRGNAWKDYSNACRYLGQFEDGLDALRYAERNYRLTPDPGTFLAIVSLCRALMFFEQEWYPQALDHVRSAAIVFERRSERTRYFEAKEVEAIVAHRMGNVWTACEIYEQAYKLADATSDPDMKARAARNLGIAYREAGDLDRASTYFLVSLQLYEVLGSKVMVVYSRWSITSLSLAAGNANDAAERLPAIVRDFDTLGIINDAARAQLDLAEAHLILGKFDAVGTTCARLFEFFSRAEMKTGAMMAASYMKEAATARRLTRRDIQAVRKYLSDLERAPDLLFVPPPPEE
jgi:tetratricopeptide (TPR) repeat protein